MIYLQTKQKIHKTKTEITFKKVQKKNGKETANMNRYPIRKDVVI